MDLPVSYLVESALWCLKDNNNRIFRSYAFEPQKCRKQYDNNCLGSHGLEKAVYSRTRSIAEGTSSS